MFRIIVHIMMEISITDLILLKYDEIMIQNIEIM